MQAVDMDNETSSSIVQIPSTTPLSNIILPSPWVLYLYDKQMFRKLAKRNNFEAKPYREICTVNTVNDIVYILQLMEVGANGINTPNGKTNLDMNDYILMRQGIEPIWEDPRNSSGGTFSIKMLHKIGYDTWSKIVMYMVGETLTSDMDYINGISVSYIPNQSTTQSDYVVKTFSDQKLNRDIKFDSENYTFIKIWDGCPTRNMEQFLEILPKDIHQNMVNANASFRYEKNNSKKTFGDDKVMAKISSVGRRGGRGGFRRR